MNRKIRCKMQCHNKSAHPHIPGMVNVTQARSTRPNTPGSRTTKTPSSASSRHTVISTPPWWKSAEILEVGNSITVEMFLAEEA